MEELLVRMDPPEEVPTTARRLIRRQRAALAVAVVAALVSAGGLAAATLIKSPAEIAAQTQPPAPTVLTAAVEKRTIRSTVVTRGTVKAGGQVSATPVQSGQGAGTQVVTGVRTAVGQQVKAGDVLVEVSGRPMVALPGEVPAYRDLKPADDGRDVTQLQQALAALGHPTGSDAAGHFGAGTKAAVTRLYQALGYDVPTTGGPRDQSDQQQLQAAQDAVDTARRQLDTAKARAARCASTPGPDCAAGNNGETPQQQVTFAQQALDKAKKTQADLVARTGPMMPLAELVFVPALPATVAQFGAKVGDAVHAPLITLAAGALIVQAKPSPAEGGLLRAGMTVDIAAETLGLTAAGTVTAIGAPTSDTSTSSGSSSSSSSSGSSDGGQQGAPSAPYVPVTVTPTAPLTTNWYGQNVRLTITSASSGGEVLAVPEAAVTAGADGRTRVTVVGGDGTQHQVEVKAGLSGEGYVAVEPVAGQLAPGDRVVTGT